jgi:hypothetical protein
MLPLAVTVPLGLLTAVAVWASLEEQSPPKKTGPAKPRPMSKRARKAQEQAAAEKAAAEDRERARKAEEAEKRKTQGAQVRGMVNLGNTCFLNASLQASGARARCVTDLACTPAAWAGGGVRDARAIHCWRGGAGARQRRLLRFLREDAGRQREEGQKGGLVRPGAAGRAHAKRRSRRRHR